jgi:hypothetical protein
LKTSHFEETRVRKLHWTGFPAARESHSRKAYSEAVYRQTTDAFICQKSNGIVAIFNSGLRRRQIPPKRDRLIKASAIIRRPIVR